MTVYEIARKTQDEGAQLLKHREGNQYNCKPMGTGNNRGWTIIDSFTGSAIVQIHDALSLENQAKYMNLPLTDLIDVTWKLASR